MLIYPETSSLSGVTTAFTSADALRLLGIQPVLGHLITPEDDKPGAAPVVVISQALWRNAFGHDPNIIGRQVNLNNSRCTVIGVMPSGFVFPPVKRSAASLDCAATGPEKPALVKPWILRSWQASTGVTLEQARAEMAQLVRGWGEGESPNNHVLSPKNHPVSLYSFYGEVVGGVRKSMTMLLLAVAFVLLIACVNVANLLLARSEARQREIAIRRAIGASNAHLIKQFIIEGTLLSFGGAALGIVLADQALRLVRNTIPEVFPGLTNSHLTGGFCCLPSWSAVSPASCSGWRRWCTPRPFAFTIRSKTRAAGLPRLPLPIGSGEFWLLRSWRWHSFCCRGRDSCCEGSGDSAGERRV